MSDNESGFKVQYIDSGRTACLRMCNIASKTNIVSLNSCSTCCNLVALASTWSFCKAAPRDGSSWPGEGQRRTAEAVPI